MNGTTPRRLRVAIIGGGIGGLSATLFLHHACGTAITINVYEQAKEFTEIGNGVGLGPNAMKLMHKIGVGAACAAISGRKSDIWFTFCRYDNGEKITIVRVPVLVDGKIVAMARSAFLDILLGFIRERNAAQLHTKKKCTGLTDLGDAVRIAFADGTTAEADLVIGCDGIRSTVRSQYIQDDAIYSGKIAYRGVVPIEKLPTSWPGETYTVIWVARDKHFLVFPINEDRSLNIVGFVTKDESKIADLAESWSSTCDRRELEDDFADCEPTVHAIIALMPERPSKWRINDRKPASQWSFLGGKVVLLGDAAHPMTPHQGAGAGQAVEDGYILGRALADYLASRRDGPEPPALERFMDLYQRVRLPRAQKVQTTSREAGELYELRSPFFEGKTYDECLEPLTERLHTRMKWIWGEELDAAYETMRAAID
ncbi:FAD/NAD(P)-binding domain-containing protein [Thozetella sp. PMI_491]|nr:FAD/NAD(P)-binding domain-containing protein [Thozetella sp. PMI_491]